PCVGAGARARGVGAVAACAAGAGGGAGLRQRRAKVRPMDLFPCRMAPPPHRAGLGPPSRFRLALACDRPDATAAPGLPAAPAANLREDRARDRIRGRLATALHRGQQAPGDALAELDTPLVEGIDAPERRLRRHRVLV